MKSKGFCLFEYDNNEDTLITFIYPSITPDLKKVIQETATFMITASNVMSLYSSYKSDFLYLEGIRNSDKASEVRLFGICVVSTEFHPRMYSGLASMLCKKAVATGHPPAVLKEYLKAVAEGEAGTFSVDDYDEDFRHGISYEGLLDRAGQSIPIVWQSLVTGKSVAMYSPDVVTLQTAAMPLLALSYPGKRNLLPLVLESSMLQTTAASETALRIWCSTDPSVLNGRHDIVIDLSTRSVKLSPALAKEGGKSSLAEALMNTINEATASESDVSKAVQEFNEQILNILGQVKAKLGSTSPQAIMSLNMSSDKKNLLVAIAASGVFEI